MICSVGKVPGTEIAQMDIHNTQTEVSIEVDDDRRVIYINIEGVTVLRVSGIPGLDIQPASTLRRLANIEGGRL